MPRPLKSKVLTANALLDGDVIYFTAERRWVTTLSDAALYEDKDSAEAALASVQDDLALVGPYLADAIKGENGPEPTHFREEFRRTGPSNYFHGKQEEVS